MSNANFQEIEENNFNLNVARYVDTVELEEEINIQSTLDLIRNLKKRTNEIEEELSASLAKLGFTM